jgi:hypothetical protein
MKKRWHHQSVLSLMTESGRAHSGLHTTALHPPLGRAFSEGVESDALYDLEDDILEVFGVTHPEQYPADLWAKFSFKGLPFQVFERLREEFTVREAVNYLYHAVVRGLKTGRKEFLPERGRDALFIPREGGKKLRNRP